MNWNAFYRPSFLWGLLFLAGILLIHLLRRPQTRELVFSTLRFFSDTAVQATRMRRLRSLLLLLVRLVAAALVIVIFASPFDRNDRLSVLRDPRLTLFTWIDPTKSMEYVESGVPLFRRAGLLVDSLKSMFPSTARHLWYDDERHEFVPFDPSRPPVCRTRFGPADLAAVFNAWNESRTGYSLPVLLLAGDFQKSTSNALDSLLTRNPVHAPLVCVTMPPHDPWNYSLTGADYEDGRGAGKVSVAVAAQGKRLDSGRIGIMVGSIGAGTAPVSVRAGDSATATLEVAGPPSGIGGRASLNADDPLRFDDTAYFALRKSGARGVVIVGDRENNFPLLAAFSAAGKGRWNPVSLRDGGEVTFDELDSAGVVVINGISRLSRTVESFLLGRSAVSKVVIFCLTTDNDGFGESAMEISKILPAARNLKLVGDSAGVPVVLPDTISETWRGFKALKAREAAVYRYGKGLPGTPLLRLDNGAALVTGFRDKEGRSWLLAATPFGITRDNNLCETGFYMPAIDRMTAFAAGAVAAPLDIWTAGYARKNPVHGTGRSASIFGYDGVLIDRWQSQAMVMFKEPGAYTVAPEGAESFAITVRLDPGEGRLEYVRPVIPAQSERFVSVVNASQLIESMKGRGRLGSYIPWLILALLLAAEVLLWERQRSGSASGR